MGVITDIHTRLENLVELTDVSTIVYDNLDAINEDAKNNYPLILYRVNSSSSEIYRNTKEKSTFTIDFYISDLYYQGDTMKVYEKKDYLNSLLNSVLKSIPKSDNDLQLINASSAEYGWEQHNDNLVVVKRTATIQGFECTSLIDQ